MNRWNSMSDDAFRKEVREFAEANFPPALKFYPLRPRWEEIKPWVMRLVDKGWSAPSWPEQYGGMGLSPSKMLVFLDELERCGVARGPDQGVVQLGPMLMQFGTEEQKNTLLPSMRKYETIWCQGYSEPNAGSDLASLTTEAVADGDDFVINGRKIWTSVAFDATHTYMLTRTSKTGKKQEGITFFLVDMKSPGVTVRGIKNIAGGTEFCEVTFENVRTPRSTMVGEMNQGWTVAKSLLEFERLNTGSPRRVDQAFARLEALATKRGLLRDPAFAERFTRLRLDAADVKAVYAYFADQVKRGERLGPDVSMMKILATETYQRITEFMLEASGDSGLYVQDEKSGTGVNSLSRFLVARSLTIGAGTNEIHRNLIAKQMLKLPS